MKTIRQIRKRIAEQEVKRDEYLIKADIAKDINDKIKFVMLADLHDHLMKELYWVLKNEK